MNARRPDDPHCFAVRRVNPFEGVLQVVETDDARAYSPDGAIWQIQVWSQRPDHTWRSSSATPPIEQYFNFGLWDAQAGLHKIPANPVMDIGAMSAAANRLGEHLRSRIEPLPFPLVDDYECWSLDQRGKPVALLATTEDRERIANLHPGPWRASRADDHGFISPSLIAQGSPAGGEPGPRQHAAQLESLVRRLGRDKAWFHRGADGSGAPVTPSRDGAALAAPDFPALGLRSDWADEEARALLEDYFCWRAPQLLTLQRIDDRQRRWLEQQARRQAIELAATFRVLPRVIDKELLEAARVEARLRGTGD